MAPRPIDLPRQSVSLSEADYRGSILVIALWSLCLLAAFSVSLGYQMRQKLALVQRLDERDRLRFINEAGIKKSIIYIMKEQDRAYDALKDDWSNNPSVFKDISIDGATSNICYNYINEQSEQLETRYGLVDEERKININKADAAVLGRLFKVVLGCDGAEAQDLAASIVDWRDSDSGSSSPPYGAEDSYYRSLQYCYDAKDAEFEVLDELLLVKGVSEDIFNMIKDYITIYGNGKVNVNTAPKSVLLALGLSEYLAGEIISFRAGEDKVSGTADDNVFDTTSNMVVALTQYSRLDELQITELTSISGQALTTKSYNFMIKATAKLDNRNNAALAICVASRDGKVLYWQEP